MCNRVLHALVCVLHFAWARVDCMSPAITGLVKTTHGSGIFFRPRFPHRHCGGGRADTWVPLASVFACQAANKWYCAHGRLLFAVRAKLSIVHRSSFAQSMIISTTSGTSRARCPHVNATLHTPVESCSLVQLSCPWCQDLPLLHPHLRGFNNW